MLVNIALLIGEGAKCPNDSLGSLRSSFIFLCEACNQNHQIMTITLKVIQGEQTAGQMKGNPISPFCNKVATRDKTGMQHELSNGMFHIYVGRHTHVAYHLMALNEAGKERTTRIIQSHFSKE